ncbi:SPOR domain-containing protein [Roseovarius sp. EGI FJ00037]|uniref:SPOR domain-containing protein n=1 Tax=Roseovarius salincola TaxID=2978479 RepID=UPI0022A82536|nr:SPOR domain-containing protein [Roseovarius sp. EGI FJ00037]MCZ0813995.1 SPOR domain-containing protein [Roseovarius sp. EGI FJ00037]
MGQFGMEYSGKVAGRGLKGAVALTASVLLLGGCQEMGNINPFKSRPDASDTEAEDAADSSSTKLVERDVEAPDVFQKTDMGLWDGRPSLGGVWVAHPDVNEPERVIIRNATNSKFVIGALFRRERENPGPAFQVSSDAAAALDMLAGAPTQLNVTALRREEAPAEPADAEESEAQVDDPAEIETTSLDPAAGAAEAIDTADASMSAESMPRPVSPPAAASRPSASSLEKPYIQIGIFSVEENARNTATAMRRNGMVPTVKEQTTQGKDFWRVIVGPAANSSERGILLKKIKGVGFEDAYPVTN